MSRRRPVSVNPELACQTGDDHILGNCIMRDKQLLPRLATVVHGMIGGILAPLHRGVFFGLYLNIVHVVVCLDLKHINAL